MPTDPTRSESRAFEWRLFPAVAVIAIGVLFLLGNLGYRLDFLYHGNWWAWFILLAALAPLTRAHELIRANGKLDAEAARNLVSAGFIVLVAALFLLNLDWGVWWPLFVILAGCGMLVRRGYPRCGSDRRWQHDRDDAATDR